MKRGRRGGSGSAADSKGPRIGAGPQCRKGHQRVRQCPQCIRFHCHLVCSTRAWQSGTPRRHCKFHSSCHMRTSSCRLVLEYLVGDKDEVSATAPRCVSSVATNRCKTEPFKMHSFMRPNLQSNCSRINRMDSSGAHAKFVRPSTTPLHSFLNNKPPKTLGNRTLSTHT